MSVPEKRPRQTPTLTLPPPPPAASPVLLSLTDATIELSDEAALSEVTLALAPAMRLCVLGPNGAGKSALLAALAGRPSLLRDPKSRTVGRGLQLLLFGQDARSGLDEEESPLERLLRLADGAADEELALEVLAELGIDRFAARRDCGSCSSGEKQKLALAGLTIAPKNLLLLDEPVSCLDVDAVDVPSASLPTRRRLARRGRSFSPRARAGTFELERKNARESSFRARVRDER